MRAASTTRRKQVIVIDIDYLDFDAVGLERVDTDSKIVMKLGWRNGDQFSWDPRTVRQLNDYWLKALRLSPTYILSCFCRMN